jgi:trk system potassium uptake protein TrkA
MSRTYAVLGLGRYGYTVARELVRSGAEVLAVDISESKVNAAANAIPICKCADVTDIDVIKQLDIANIDVVIVAMANNLEASVMAITLCKEVGVKTVIAKCSRETHGRILAKVGADKVVFPEKESGIRLAKNLLSSGFVDVIELSDDVSMVELDVNVEWSGKNLIELDLRKKYGINIVGIREGNEVVVNIDPTKPLSENMKLIVIGNTSKINKISK